MRSKKTVNLLLQNWKDTRKLTFDWIDKISEQQLNQKLPRIGLDTFAKQILEMADVEISYSLRLKTNKLDFSNVTDGGGINKKITKRFLKKSLQNSGRTFLETFRNVDNWDEKIKVFNRFLPRYSIIELLTRHETLHHGQFIAYGFLLGLKFPKSWVDTWAIPQGYVKK